MNMRELVLNVYYDKRHYLERIIEDKLNCLLDGDDTTELDKLMLEQKENENNILGLENIRNKH